jgi:hypothetical protein
VYTQLHKCKGNRIKEQKVDESDSLFENAWQTQNKHDTLVKKTTSVTGKHSTSATYKTVYFCSTPKKRGTQLQPKRFFSSCFKRVSDWPEMGTV